MASSDKLITIVSRKGQITLPRPVRDQRRWAAGTRLTVENMDDGVLLRAAPAFPPTRPEDVFGSLCQKGAPKSLAEMDTGFAAEAKRRHARRRY